MKYICLLFVVFFLSNCATTSQYVQRLVGQATANADSATIYLIRPSILGSAVKAGVYQDDKQVGRLGPKNFLHWAVPAGKQIEIVSKTGNRARLSIIPEAGKTYFLKQKIGMGFLIARSGLEEMEEEKAAKKLARLRGPIVEASE
jgi:hypothetical protein